MAGLTRKELLAGAAATGVLVGCGGSPQRDDGLRHFDAFVLASHPPAVRAAIEKPPARPRRRRGRLPARARARAERSRCGRGGGGCLGVQAQDLAFTDSTTMGLGLVYGGIQVDGDEV